MAELDKGTHIMSEAVASPKHYVQGHIEAIYVIEQVLGKEGFRQFCMGNYLKYKMRHEHKNGDEDLQKALVYLDWATNGLPAPVNNRVPHKQKEGEARASNSIAAVLQHELDILKPGYWTVGGVTTIPAGRKNKVIADIEHKETDFRIRVVLDNVHEGARYADIVFDLIAEAKQLHPAGPWK